MFKYSIVAIFKNSRWWPEVVPERYTVATVIIQFVWHRTTVSSVNLSHKNDEVERAL